jgi:inositol phosphorylceramide mannosyltransferase catalytic subunit
LRPTNELFKEYNITTLKHLEIIAQREIVQGNGHGGEIESPMKAFFGKMDTNRTVQQSTPNAWMASTPAHPFFLVSQWAPGNSWLSLLTGPAYATGPGALYRGIHEYQKAKYHRPEALSQLQRHVPKMIPPLSLKSKHEVVLLPPHYVYPYTWDQDRFEFTPWCSAQSPNFNATKCKELTNVDRLGSYSITYWSHTWTRRGHNDDSIAKVSS